MITPVLTNEILAEIEEELASARELDVNAAITPAHLEAILAERADHLQQLSAAAITAENCELFRKNAERYQWIVNNCEISSLRYGVLENEKDLDAARAIADT